MAKPGSSQPGNPHLRVKSRHTRREQRLTAVDLFSGCGGLTTGLKKAGFKVVGAVEVDPLAAQTYLANHPEVCVVQKDIREVGAKDLLKTKRRKTALVDVLAGCPPCQGFSALRTANGGRNVRDKRNALVAEFARFARELRPRAVMFENVPGLAERPEFKRLLRSLRGQGYWVRWNIVNAADYGVPQRRHRLIALGIKRRTPKFGHKARKTISVIDSIGDLDPVSRSKDVLHQNAIRRSKKTVRLIRRIPKDGGSRADLPKKYWLKCHRRHSGHSDVYGRMSWGEVAPTITGGCINPSKGRFLHPRAHRAITPREAALLQSFPAKYKFLLKRGTYAVAEMIGNAFPPELARRHALAVARALRAPNASSR